MMYVTGAILLEFVELPFILKMDAAKMTSSDLRNRKA